MFSKVGLKHCPDYRKYYYDFLIIPLEFLFLYWLYCWHALDNKRLFWISSAIYLGSFAPHLLLFKEPPLVYSFSYVTGNLLLLIMACLEFFKQIQTEKILHFKKNMMFYVNSGVILFYIGTLPFFTFYGLLLKDLHIWNYYYVFFLAANNIMYLFFTAAFVWGKPNT
ncbi:hypothetical protein HYN49_08225 [Flavobacterium pallidum]|uniref:Uncharacterized protein n=2 Tax=Flavobacterium pallidum TaxID=2172098 RepID=A0A2S1SHJ8_9FLAO|nr:hypothetical protein HYN49_08225 [Flavobacterium pallidum]